MQSLPSGVVSCSLYMPQQMNTLKTEKINRDAVALGPLNLGITSEEVDERAMNTFSIAAATRPEDRTPYRLSGGKKRSVSIASVPSLSPSLRRLIQVAA